MQLHFWEPVFIQFESAQHKSLECQLWLESYFWSFFHSASVHSLPSIRVRAERSSYKDVLDVWLWVSATQGWPPRVQAVQNVGETGWCSVNRLPEPPPEAREAELDNICWYFMLEGMGFAFPSSASVLFRSIRARAYRPIWKRWIAVNSQRWRSRELPKVQSWY